MFKLFGIALFRAHDYGVLHAAAFIIIALLLILFVYRRYHRLLQKDRAAKALQRTNVFVVLDSSTTTNNSNTSAKNGNNDDESSSSLMKDLEEFSDEDEDDVDYAKLLRELDTPANLLKEKQQQNGNGNGNDDDDDDDKNSSSASPPPLPPASTTRSRPFSLRLMDAIEHTAVTQLAELIRLHSSMHQQQNKDSKKFMDQIAVFDIPENIARNRAVALLEGALRQRRRDAAVAMMMMSSNQQQHQNQQQHDIEDEIYHSLFDNHCSSSIPSPASILSTNRRNIQLVGTAKSNAPFMRQREAYYCTCIDSALGVEDATLNFATHFAYGTDVGQTPSNARILGNFFLGENRFAKSNLRGGHIVTAGGAMATMPDPLVCRRDLLLHDRTSNTNGSSSSSSSHQNGDDQLFQQQRFEELSSFKDLSDDWAKGTGWSSASGDGLNLLRRYDDLVVLCIRSGGGGGKTTKDAKQKSSSSTSSSNWNIPSCVPLFSSVHQSGSKKQPRVVACTTPYSVKYLLPEYASPRDSTISSKRRYRYHLENVKAIRRALEKHAEDIAVEGFAVGERVRFKRSVVNRAKEGIADAFFAFGKILNVLPKTSTVVSSSNSNRSNKNKNGDDDEEEMSRLVDENTNKEKNV